MDDYQLMENRVREMENSLNLIDADPSHLLELCLKDNSALLTEKLNAEAGSLILEQERIIK